MGLKTLFLLAAVLACVSVGSAIKCYVCAGSTNSDCAKGTAAAMSVVNCKAPGAHHHHRSYSHPNITEYERVALRPVCLKLVETDYLPKLFARGCGIFPDNIDACDFLQQNSHVTNCKACKTDLCNLRHEITDEYDALNFIN